MDLDEAAVYADLKKYKNKLFKAIFSEKKFRRRRIFEKLAGYGRQFEPKPEPQYVNPLRKLSVFVRGREVGEEIFFVCLGQKRRTSRVDEIKLYFVSEEYNVNAAYMNRNAPYITGRFIFEYNDAKQLVVIALAEEPALITAQGIGAEMKYAEMKMKSHSSSVSTSDQ